MTDALGAGTRLAQRYEIEEVIGRGRSPVYRARDTRLSRAVAVKEVGLAAGAGASGRADRARALREARSAARVLSPSAVQVYDVVEERSAVWLVMELVRAPSLDRLVAEGGPLGEVRAALVGLWVLDALEAAHGQDVVHRDVRPANVLVGDLDDAALDVPVKLADFGLAALRDDTSVTAPGAISGSPAFTAPEQAAGRKVGPEADLWALGAVLYFAVEGEAPFAGESPKEVAAAVVRGDVRPAQRLDRLGRIVEMLLDTQPERRPDAGRVRVVLRSVAAGTEPGDDTLEAPNPAGPTLAAAAAAGVVAADPTAVAGAGAGGPTAVAGAGIGDPTAVAGAGVGDPVAVAGAGGPTVVAGAGDRDPTPATGAGIGGPGAVAGARGGPASVGGTGGGGAHGRAPGGRGTKGQTDTRRRPLVPYLVAAAAALLVLAGLAVVQGRGADDREPDPTQSPLTTVEPTTTEPPESDDAEPADRGGPPVTAPAGGGEAPEDPEPSEGEEGPGVTAPETTTTAPPEDTTTTTPTTEPPATTTTAPTTTETPTTTAGTDAGAGGGAQTLATPGAATLTSPGD